MGETSAEPTVRLRGASLGYGARLLWQDLDLTVAPGEFVAVLGPNGSGKTSRARRLGDCRAVNSNGCASPRPCWETLTSCSATRRCSRSTSNISAMWWGSSTAGAGRSIPRCCSSPTRSIPSCPSWIASFIWWGRGGRSGPPTRCSPARGRLSCTRPTSRCCALIAADGGLVLSLVHSDVKASVFFSTISFALYLVARATARYVVPAITARRRQMI